MAGQPFELRRHAMPSAFSAMYAQIPFMAISNTANTTGYISGRVNPFSRPAGWQPQHSASAQNFVQLMAAASAARGRRNQTAAHCLLPPGVYSDHFPRSFADPRHHRACCSLAPCAQAAAETAGEPAHRRRHSAGIFRGVGVTAMLAYAEQIWRARHEERRLSRRRDAVTDDHRAAQTRVYRQSTGLMQRVTTPRPGN